VSGCLNDTGLGPVGEEGMSAALSMSSYDAVAFDLDGVITDTAAVHEQAWRRLFDGFLAETPGLSDQARSGFTSADCLAFVDGNDRYDGARDFLRSRGIDFPVGQRSDPADLDTVHGLANRKDRYFLERLAEDGVTVFPGSVRLVRQLQKHGLGTAVVSASRHCREVLEAARRLHTHPRLAVVVEDAEAGVAAGRRGGFGLVVGVDRGGQRGRLLANGADIVVAGLDEFDLAVHTDGPTGRDA
jgi:alpha,alpha-trehalase